MKVTTYYCDVCRRKAESLLDVSLQHGPFTDSKLSRTAIGGLCHDCHQDLERSLREWQSSREPLEVVDE